MPQIAFIPGPHAVGAAAAPLDKDKDASAKTHPLQTVRAGKRIIKIRGSTGGRSFHEPVILSSKDGILESPGSSGLSTRWDDGGSSAMGAGPGDSSEGFAAVQKPFTRLMRTGNYLCQFDTQRGILSSVRLLVEMI